MKTRLRDPASWLPLAAGGEFTQPCLHLWDEYCICNHPTLLHILETENVRSTKCQLRFVSVRSKAFLLGKGREKPFGPNPSWPQIAANRSVIIAHFVVPVKALHSICLRSFPFKEFWTDKWSKGVNDVWIATVHEFKQTVICALLTADSQAWNVKDSHFRSLELKTPFTECFFHDDLVPCVSSRNLI